MDILLIFLSVVFSYFVGNVHFARIIAGIKKDDITKHGSGNPGTMNMVRTHGFILGSITLLLDSTKGAVCALIGFYALTKYGALYTVNPMISVYPYLLGLICVIGHIFPVIHKFKGGKGVATAVGVFTVVNPLVSLVAFVVGLLIWFIFRIGSLSSLVYILGFSIWQTILVYSSGAYLSIAVLWLIVFLVYFAHRENINRLIRGKESRFSFKDTLNKDKEIINKNIK